MTCALALLSFLFYICVVGQNPNWTNMDRKIVAYYGSWKVYSTCKIEEIDPFVADVLIYAFAGLNVDATVKVLDDWGDVQMQGYAKFNQLKARNHKLKTLLSIGGWNEGSVNFSNMARGENTRRTFTHSCLRFLQKYGFDGIDLNWEYPCQRGGHFKDKENLSQLLKEMREEFDKHGYILTMAVGASESIADVSYDILQLSQYLNYIFVMTYDFHTHADGHTGANAPLRSNDQLNVEYCVKLWIRKGADPGKLLLGTGGYGHSYTLADASNHSLGAASIGPGLPGPDSKTPGILQYGEIIDLEKRGWTKEWSDEQQVPYSYHGNQWVAYDDVTSILKKVNFAKDIGLRGVMLWAIDMDDPRGQHGVKFPLLKAVKEKLSSTATEKILQVHLEDAGKIKTVSPLPPKTNYLQSPKQHRLLEKPSMHFADSLRKMLPTNPSPEPIKSGQNVKSPTLLDYKCYSSSKKEEDPDFKAGASQKTATPKCGVCRSKFKIKRCKKLDAPYYSFVELLRNKLQARRSRCNFCQRSNLRKKFHTSSLQPNIFRPIDALNQCLMSKPHPYLIFLARKNSYLPNFPQLKHLVTVTQEKQRIRRLPLNSIEALELLYWQISTRTKHCNSLCDSNKDGCDKNKLAECEIDDEIKRPECPPKPSNTKVCPKDLLIKKKKKIKPNNKE